MLGKIFISNKKASENVPIMLIFSTFYKTVNFIKLQCFYRSKAKKKKRKSLEIDLCMEITFQYQ